MAPAAELRGGQGESMKKGIVIGALLVVLTLSLGGSAVSKVTDNAATY